MSAEIDILNRKGNPNYPKEEQCLLEWIHPRKGSMTGFQYRFSCPEATKFELRNSTYIGRQKASGKVVMKCVQGCPQNPYVTLEYSGNEGEQ